MFVWSHLDRPCSRPFDEKSQFRIALDPWFLTDHFLQTGQLNQIRSRLSRRDRLFPQLKKTCCTRPTCRCGSCYQQERTEKFLNKKIDWSSNWKVQGLAGLTDPGIQFLPISPNLQFTLAPFPRPLPNNLNSPCNWPCQQPPPKGTPSSELLDFSGFSERGLDLRLPTIYRCLAIICL